MSRAKKPTKIQCPDPTSFTEQLNTFYTRFNRTDPMGDWSPNNTSHAPAEIYVQERKVVSILFKLHRGKLLDQKDSSATH